MKIRFIVDSFSSARDTNGNTYHFCRIHSTKTGKSVSMLTEGARNGTSKVIDAFREFPKHQQLGFEHIHSTETTLPKRNWQGFAREISLYEHTANVLGAIRALEFDN